MIPLYCHIQRIVAIFIDFKRLILLILFQHFQNIQALIYY